MPLDRAALDALLERVDEKSGEQGCDHTLRFAQAEAEQAGRDWESLADALRQAGGCCDCEVVANVNRWIEPPARPPAEREQVPFSAYGNLLG